MSNVVDLAERKAEKTVGHDWPEWADATKILGSEFTTENLANLIELARELDQFFQANFNHLGKIDVLVPWHVWPQVWYEPLAKLYCHWVGGKAMPKHVFDRAVCDCALYHLDRYIQATLI